MDLKGMQTDPYVIAFMMMIWLVASRNFHEEVDDHVRLLMQSPALRLLVVFTALFIASRDFKASLFMTGAFFLIFRVLLCRDHPWCILPYLIPQVSISAGIADPPKTKSLFEAPVQKAVPSRWYTKHPSDPLLKT